MELFTIGGCVSEKVEFKLGQISATLEAQDKALERIETTLSTNTAALSEHMRRTNLAEANIEHLRSQVQPIEDHVKFVRTLMKFGTWCAGLVGAGTTLWKLLNGGL